MKKLTIKEIFITIITSYLIVSYVNNQFNPFLLSEGARFIQLVLIGISFVIQLLIKNDL
jgi:hypothetical protein